MLALVTFLTIWGGHVLVRITHYYFGTSPAPPFSWRACSFCSAAPRWASTWLSAAAGHRGAHPLWDAFELHRQEVRVRLGHAPLNPKVHKVAAGMRRPAGRITGNRGQETCVFVWLRADDALPLQARALLQSPRLGPLRDERGRLQRQRPANPRRQKEGPPHERGPFCYSELTLVHLFRLCDYAVRDIEDRPGAVRRPSAEPLAIGVVGARPSDLPIRSLTFTPVSVSKISGTWATMRAMSAVIWFAPKPLPSPPGRDRW